MKYVRSAAVVALLTLTAACGSPTAQPTHPVSPTAGVCMSCTRLIPRPNPDYQGPVTATHRIGDQGEVWMSPRADQVHPPATWQSIWSHLCGGSPATCDPKGRTTIILARVTLPFPAKLNHDGTSTREFVDRLMYVFTTTGSACSPVGGRWQGASPSPAPRRAYACTSRSYYDANTGHFWFGSSEGTPA